VSSTFLAFISPAQATPGKGPRAMHYDFHGSLTHLFSPVSSFLKKKKKRKRFQNIFYTCFGIKTNVTQAGFVIHIHYFDFEQNLNISYPLICGRSQALGLGCRQGWYSQPTLLLTSSPAQETCLDFEP
jgi:hypothetical protein